MVIMAGLNSRHGWIIRAKAKIRGLGWIRVKVRAKARVKALAFVLGLELGLG